MAQAVYRRSGMAFKATILVTANPNDTVTVTGPKDYNESAKADSTGKALFLIKKKGTYTASGTESGITANVDCPKGQNIEYTVDVSFEHTLNVQANKSVTVTCSAATGSKYSYSATSNGTTGIAAVKLRRVGTYNVSSTASTSGTVLSADPASSSTVTITENQNRASSNMTYVRVSTLTGLYSGPYSNLVAYLYWGIGNSTLFSGVMARYNTSSNPDSKTSGSLLGTGAGASRTISKTAGDKNCFTLNCSDGTTYYFSAWSYIEIASVKYYAGSSSTTSWKCSKTGGTKAITATETWTIPAGVRTLNVFCCGGGGGGGVSATGYSYGGGGGGGGYCASGTIAVVPGQSAYCVIGPGGAGHASTHDNRNHQDGDRGGTTVLYIDGDRKLNGDGGFGGNGYYSIYDGTSGGSGGSGGGAGSFGLVNNETDYGTNAGDGGSNGGDGGSVSFTAAGKTYSCSGGKGIGATAVTFNNVVYAGGGGGGRSSYGVAGSGGTRGGGAGGNVRGGVAESGTAGTGGGGGGAAHLGNTSSSWSSVDSGAGGSGVMVINYS